MKPCCTKVVDAYEATGLAREGAALFCPECHLRILYGEVVEVICNECEHEPHEGKNCPEYVGGPGTWRCRCSLNADAQEPVEDTDGPWSGGFAKNH